MLKIMVIMGSSRPNRKSHQVAEWFTQKASINKNFEFEVIDLAEVGLPFFDESLPPMFGQYKNQHTKDWAAKVGAADGYVLVTPEYNHGYSAVLKNALDFLYAEWRRKPVAFVSYGVQYGVRAVEQLKPIAVQLDMAPLNAGVWLNVMSQWTKEGEFKPDDVNEQQLEQFLAELQWWGEALKAAR